ncbi:MAG: anti-sigma factor [Nocardioides sp.]
MSEIHALSGAFAMDALDDIERAQFERHLASCPECRAETEGLFETTGVIGSACAATPPAALRARVLADIAATRPLPPRFDSPARVQPVRRRWVPALVAASVLLVGGVGAVAWHPWTDSTSQQQVSAIDRVLHAPDAQKVKADVGGGTAIVVRSASLGKAVIMADGVRNPPHGKVYELWLQAPDGSLAPAGLMGTGSSVSQVFEGDASQARAAAITVEPAGGSDTPSSAPVASFPLRSAT